MYLKSISLENFRNYEKQKIEFNKNINVIYGNNAQGKTNIIEAIFLCAYGKSFRAKKDIDLIKFDEENATVNLTFEKIDREGKIKAVINNEKKVFFSNGIKLAKISDIVGKINVVIFTPDDINIIKEGPKERRRFIDMMISSLKPNYLHLLNLYNKVIEQRNNYLRQIKLESKSPNMLEVWDEQLADYSSKIYEYRNLYINKISERIDNIYKKIVGNDKESIKIRYISSGKDKETFFLWTICLNLNNKRGFTSTGIHRDDFILYINGRPAGVYGSQGQKRTLLLSLKICELDIIKEEINDTPILLLDDFMSELDESRRNNFLENIKDNQIIITCTDKIAIDNDYYQFFVENGKCKKE